MKINIKLLILIFLFSKMTLVFSASIKQDLLSPVTTDASYVFWPGFASTLALVITEDQYSDPATIKTAKAKPLGSWSEVGDLYGQLYPNIIYTFGMLGHGLISKNGKTSLENSSHMFRATLYAGLVTTLIKYTAREPRPDNSQEKNSFPSGHTTTAFAFAGVVAINHSWYLGAAALGGAALTAYSRMNDGRHFLHDVAGGATIGLSYALGTYFTKKGQGKRYALFPWLGPSDSGLRFVASF